MSEVPLRMSSVQGRESGSRLPIFEHHRGTSLIRKHIPLGPYSTTIPRALWGVAVFHDSGAPVIDDALYPSGGGRGSRVPLWKHLGQPSAVRPEASYRGTSLARKQPPLGPYPRPMPSVLGGSSGGGRFLMGEVPL